MLYIYIYIMAANYPIFNPTSNTTTEKVTISQLPIVDNAIGSNSTIWSSSFTASQIAGGGGGTDILPTNNTFTGINTFNQPIITSKIDATTNLDINPTNDLLYKGLALNSADSMIKLDSLAQIPYSMIKINDTQPTPIDAFWSSEYTNRTLTSKILNIKATSSVIVGTVVLASNSNISGTFNPVNGQLTGFTFPLVIDSVTVNDAEFVLLVGQTDEKENGVYLYDVATPKLLRFGPINNHYYEGATYNITSGTLYAGSQWYVLPNAPTVITGATLSLLSPIYFGRYDTADAQTAINKTDITTINSNISNVNNTSDANKPISTASNNRMTLIESSVTQVEAGVQYKKAVKTATITILPNNPTYDSGAGTLIGSSNGQLSIGTAVLNDRLLIKNQVDQRENGVYTIQVLGSAGSVYSLLRALDLNGDPSSEIEGGNVITSTDPLEMYVLTGYGIIIINDPVLANNGNLIYSAFGASTNPNLSISTLDTSGVINCGGAMNINNGSLVTMTGGLDVTGTSNFYGPIGTLGTISILDVSGTADVGGVFDAAAACHLRGAVSCYAAVDIVGALTGTTMTNLTGRVTALESGVVPVNTITVGVIVQPDNNYGATIGTSSLRFVNSFTQYGNIEENLNVGTSTGASNGKIYVNRGATNTIELDSTTGRLNLKNTGGVSKIILDGDSELIHCKSHLPLANETGNLGSSGVRFLDIYAKNLNLNGPTVSSASITLSGGTSHFATSGGGYLITQGGNILARNSAGTDTAVIYGPTGNISCKAIACTTINALTSASQIGTCDFQDANVGLYNRIRANSVQFWTSNGLSGLRCDFSSGQGFKSGGGSWANNSDIRLKENIQNVDPVDASARLMALRSVTYNYTAEACIESGEDVTKRFTGFIANEFNQIYVPRTPATRKLVINGVEDDYLTLTTNKMLFEIPAAHTHLVNLIEAQQLVIDSLLARVTALENP
jgi:hypothetical protein